MMQSLAGVEPVDTAPCVEISLEPSGCAQNMEAFSSVPAPMAIQRFKAAMGDLERENAGIVSERPSPSIVSSVKMALSSLSLSDSLPVKDGVESKPNMAVTPHVVHETTFKTSEVDIQPVEGETASDSILIAAPPATERSVSRPSAVCHPSEPIADDVAVADKTEHAASDEPLPTSVPRHEEVKSYSDNRSRPETFSVLQSKERPDDISTGVHDEPQRATSGAVRVEPRDAAHTERHTATKADRHVEPRSESRAESSTVQSGKLRAEPRIDQRENARLESRVQTRSELLPAAAAEQLQIVAPAPLPIELPAAAVQQPPSAPVMSADVTRMFVAAAEAVADAILVSSGFDNGEGRIIVRLHPEVLGGSEVQIVAKDGKLTVVVNPATQDVQNIVEANRTQFEQHLAEKVHAWRVSVAVKRGDKSDERV